MTDLEQMITGLESMANHMYFGETVPVSEFDTLLETVEYLKDRRPVKPQWLDDKPNCGYCGITIPGGAKYCQNCGRMTKMIQIDTVLPENCYLCFCMADSICRIKHWYIPVNMTTEPSKRPEWCPMKQVPEEGGKE